MHSYQKDDSPSAPEPRPNRTSHAPRDGAPPSREREAPAQSPIETSGRASWPQPWVQVKYWSFSPAIYSGMIAAVSPAIKPGSAVTVYDRNGQVFGGGIFNKNARVPLRVHHHTPAPLDDAWFLSAIQRAISLRRELLQLDATTEAYRVINSDGDGLSGLIIDRYGDVLLIEVHTLGIWQRLEAWLPMLHAALGTTRHLLRADPEIARMEGFRVPEQPAIKSVRIREHGLRFEVNFADGHKTGHFCDQRENRLLLSKMVQGQRVLDLCCCTGGFSLAAKHLGQAASVTAVDLDEKAIAQAKQNANLNQCRTIDWVHTDAFTYARTMIRNGTTWDTVILDPPKLVHSRDDELDDGRRRYEDLNGLSIQLVKPGGLFVTCSCSGLLSTEEFERIVTKAAHRNKRRLQFIHHSGPGGDHPVMSNCPEGRYLKVLWARVI